MVHTPINETADLIKERILVSLEQELAHFHLEEGRLGEEGGRRRSHSGS